MAAIPSLETILLSVHQALGCEATLDKRKLQELRRNLDGHKQDLERLLDDILAEMGLDAAAKDDAKVNLLKFASFHKAIEIGTWTFGATSSQVAWYLLSCVYIPGLARHAAFWQLAAPMDAGMPGGDFWYLPRVVEQQGKSLVQMPLAGVLDWLEDLLGRPVHEAAISWVHGQTEVDPESAKRTLARWRKGDVPRNSIIQTYFVEGTEFEFNGCLTIDDAAPDEVALGKVKAFLKHKGLSAEDLRRQIPMLGAGRIEAALEGRSSREEQKLLTELVRQRYARPNLRTIRNRLVITRAVQHGYRDLVALLCPSIDPTDADPSKNKVLQLFEIYKRVYNLTIQAGSVSEDVHEQDAWFEARLAPWDKGDLFLSILPSKRHSSAEELPSVLTSRFACLGPDQPLEDWMAFNTDGLPQLLEARRARFARDLAEIEGLENTQRALRTQAPELVLAAVVESGVARALATSNANPRIRLAAAKRMAELAKADAERLDALLIHMDVYLNSRQQPEPPDAQAIVEDLLRQADSNPARPLRLPQLLNSHAKHCLRGNQFPGARKYFREALEACWGDSCGDLPGLIARDLFALDAATKPNGYHVDNYERHVRLMATSNVITGLHHALPDVARELASYFWQDFYRPYPNVEAVPGPNDVLH